MKYFSYLSYVLKHKWFVFRAGLVTKAPIWQLVIHDWSKFLPVEFFPYAEHFYGFSRNQPDRQGTKKFVFAWLHHVHLNPHHWNHWALVGSSGKVKAQEMPERYVREMMADWIGAGRGITGSWDNIDSWFHKNIDTMVLHVNTRVRLFDLFNKCVRPWLDEMKETK